MFVVVLILTVAFLVLYGVGTEAAFDSIDAEAAGAALDVDDEVLTGSTLLGLAMFTTLFLGCVLAVFLTLGAVRGDAERGPAAAARGAAARAHRAAGRALRRRGGRVRGSTSARSTPRRW